MIQTLWSKGDAAGTIGLTRCARDGYQVFRSRAAVSAATEIARLVTVPSLRSGDARHPSETAAADCAHFRAFGSVICRHAPPSGEVPATMRPLWNTMIF